MPARVPTTRAQASTAYLGALVALLVLYAIELLFRIARLHNKFAPSGHTHDAAYLAAIIAVGILETIALFALANSVRSTGASIPWAIAAFAVMVSLSLLSPDTEVIGSPDAYAYVGYAKLPALRQAYAPPPYSFSGGFDVINKSWGNPIVPSDYGPLWLLYDRLTLHRTATMEQALLVMRAFNIVFLIALVAALRRLRMPNCVLVLVALNPMLWYYYVVEAHNDIGAILLVVIGMLVARKNAWLGAVVAGAAGLIKIPFALIASAAMGRRNVFLSLSQTAVIVALTIAGSSLFGGFHYLNSVIGTGQWMVFQGGDIAALGARREVYVVGLVAHACVALIAAGAFIASQSGSFIASAIYSFSGVAPTLYPHYLGWCIPYALRMPKVATPFFAALPAVSHWIVYPAGSFGVLADLYFVAIIAVFARHLWLTKSARRRELPVL